MAYRVPRTAYRIHTPAYVRAYTAQPRSPNKRNNGKAYSKTTTGYQPAIHLEPFYTENMRLENKEILSILCEARRGERGTERGDSRHSPFVSQGAAERLRRPRGAHETPRRSPE